MNPFFILFNIVMQVCQYLWKTTFKAGRTIDIKQSGCPHCLGKVSKKTPFEWETFPNMSVWGGCFPNPPKSPPNHPENHIFFSLKVLGLTMDDGLREIRLSCTGRPMGRYYRPPSKSPLDFYTLQNSFQLN